MKESIHVKRFGTAEEAEKLVSFLASKKDYITEASFDISGGV